MGGWSHSRLAPAINSERFEIFEAEGLASGGGVAMGFGVHDPLGEHPGAIPRQRSEAVFEAAAAALGFSCCRVGVLTGVGVAEVSRARVGDIGGVDGHDGAVDVAVNHGHHVIFDAVLVPFTLAADEHFGSHFVGVTGGEGVLTVGLLEAATHAMDRDFPELGIHRLEDLFVFNAVHLGFEIGTDLKRALDPLIALLPDAAAAIAGESRLPGVAVLVGATEVITQVASRLNGNGGCHNGEVASATLPVA